MTLSIRAFASLTIAILAVFVPSFVRGAVLDLDLMAQAEPGSVREEVRATQVAVEYKQRGHLLALVPITYTLRVVAYADGRLVITYPWYRSITLNNREELKAKLESAVDHALLKESLGSVRGEGVMSTPTWSEAEALKVYQAIERVLKENLEAQSEG